MFVIGLNEAPIGESLYVEVCIIDKLISTPLVKNTDVIEQIMILFQLWQGIDQLFTCKMRVVTRISFFFTIELEHDQNIHFVFHLKHHFS